MAEIEILNFRNKATGAEFDAVEGSATAEIYRADPLIEEIVVEPVEINPASSTAPTAPKAPAKKKPAKNK